MKLVGKVEEDNLLNIDNRYIPITEEQNRIFKHARVDIGNNGFILFPTKLYRLSRLLKPLYQVEIAILDDDVVKVPVALDLSKLPPHLARAYEMDITHARTTVIEHFRLLIQDNVIHENVLVGKVRTVKQPR